MTLLRLHTVARIGARTLVVAGFAGAAWLLSSAAAHAAAPAGPVPQVSAATAPIGSILGGTTGSAARPALSLLGQVLAPSGSTRPVHHPARTAAAPVTRMFVPHAASQAERAEHPAPLPLISSLADLVRPLTGTTQGVIAPLTGILALPAGPPTGWTLPIARPISVPRADSGTVAPAGVASGCPAGSTGTVAQPFDCSGSAASTVARPGAASARVRPVVGSVMRVRPVTHRHAPSGTGTVPSRPEPAPLPAYPGSGTHGISTTASGSSHDAGGYAVVTTAAESGHPAGVRRLRAIEVAVRPLLADAPTFAPD